VAKPDLGTKRVCPETGRKFYDLNKEPVISPYTGHVVPIAVAPARAARADAAAAARAAAPVPAEEVVTPETPEAEFVSLEDADAEAQGKKTPEGEAVEGADEEIELDEPMDDAPFIEEQEEGDEDVADIIGDVEDDEEA
jgi:uncharacterized protein (TIGR02300 family)